MCPAKTTSKHGYCDEHAHFEKPWSRGKAGQGRGGRPWRRKRTATLERDRYLCQPCLRNGRATPATEVDHIVSKGAGGSDSDDNLESTCHTCHQSKTLEEARRARQGAA